MMKWKVVKNPRSLSADRSLECLRKELTCNDTNNNESNGQTSKENNRQRTSSLVRRAVTTECINLKSILGLSRQRSETNLSSLGLVPSEQRRSRSEVRGVSCDRLTVTYLKTPIETGQTRSSSPPCRPGWLRGRKRERESRNPTKDVLGKTVVTGSDRTSSVSENSDCRTIVDGSDKSRKGKSRKSEADIIEEEIYMEINQDLTRGGRLPKAVSPKKDNKDSVKDLKKVIRKKGQAPKPQISKAMFKEGEASGTHNRHRVSCSPTSLQDAVPKRKPPRKTQTYSGRNQDRRNENRVIHTVKLNNSRNNASVNVNNNINTQPVVAVAEIHEELVYLSMDNVNRNIIVPESPESETSLLLSDTQLPKNLPNELEEPLPFHIDTPDYSTLESVNSESFELSAENTTFSSGDVLNGNLNCDESVQESQRHESEVVQETFVSSILRDSATDNCRTDSESKKVVRFEKMDLIELYQKQKTNDCFNEKEESVSVESTDENNETHSESKKMVRFEKLDLIEQYQKLKSDGYIDTEDEEILVTECHSLLDVNSNEIDELEDCFRCPGEQPTEVFHDPSSVTMNVLVRNPSPVPPPVVNKSFVLTIAKQEKGFKSLFANKRSELVVPLPTPTKSDRQISVTFLCNELPPPVCNQQRLRSTSVPPVESPVELSTVLPTIRGRSRDRKSKERQHCKKNRSRKKDAVFVMPQAVIDELSQVLEKRNPAAPTPL